MGKLLKIPTYSQPKFANTSTAQVAANKRAKTRAVLLRLRAGQNVCKIGLTEQVGWTKLTEILHEFIDWNRVNAYVSGNKRAA